MDKEGIMEFSGPHAELFRDYVVYKRTLGYSIGYGYQAVLRDISRHLADLPQRACVIGKSAAERIAERRGGESVSYQCKRITILRQFCAYLTSRGFEAHVLPLNLVRDTTGFTPRIIDEKEMARTIDAADRTMQDWVGLLLRILWCCGLRINEALHLDVGDIVEATEALVVRNAKGDRMRLCPASPSLYSHIRSYMKRHGLERADGSTPLIPSADGAGHRSHVTAAVKIREAFAKAGVTRPEGGVPRPHDIRYPNLHGIQTFALKSS